MLDPRGLKLKVTQTTPGNVTVEVRDHADRLRADVYVEIHDGKVTLVVTDHIEERNTSDPTAVVKLLADVPEADKQPLP